MKDEGNASVREYEAQDEAPVISSTTDAHKD
jgi:hypothetical protein